MMIAAPFGVDCIDGIHGSELTRIRRCPSPTRTPPAPWCFALASSPSGYGLSGLHRRGRRFHLEILKDARYKFAHEFLRQGSYNLAWIIGAIRAWAIGLAPTT